MHKISWEQLVDQQPLPDGDIIAVQVRQGDVPADQIEIALAMSGGMTWWKGMEVVGNPIIVQCQDQTGYDAMRFPYATFHELKFAKAKALGVHTDMYQLASPTEHMKAGYSYLFTWRKDG